MRLQPSSLNWERFLGFRQSPYDRHHRAPARSPSGCAASWFGDPHAEAERCPLVAPKRTATLWYVAGVQRRRINLTKVRQAHANSGEDKKSLCRSSELPCVPRISVQQQTTAALKSRSLRVFAGRRLLPSRTLCRACRIREIRGSTGLLDAGDIDHRALPTHTEIRQIGFPDGTSSLADRKTLQNTYQVLRRGRGSNQSYQIPIPLPASMWDL